MGGVTIHSAEAVAKRKDGVYFLDRKLKGETVMNGRWIKVSGNICEDDYVAYKCSVCGEESKWERGMKTIYPSAVCPYCDSDMISRRTASSGIFKNDKIIDRVQSLCL